jgi:ribosomal protein L12E/L44/L45/RPP1/RPP2
MDNSLETAGNRDPSEAELKTLADLWEDPELKEALTNQIALITVPALGALEAAAAAGRQADSAYNAGIRFGLRKLWLNIERAAQEAKNVGKE